jgi:hypothetical protein
MNNGAVFRPSLQTGRMVQTRQLEPYRGTNQQPCDYPIKAQPTPVPPPPRAPVQAVEVLDVDV